MTTAYTSLLGLALPVTGELSGTWGDTVNNSITSLLDSAVAGTTTLSTDADVTLTTTTGAANTAREAILLCSGARTGIKTITAPAQSKIYTIINATTGGYSVKVVGVGPTTGVTIVAGESAVIAWNGSDFIKISNSGGAASFTNVTVSGTTTLSGLTASTALALDASKNVVSVTNTGTGNNVLAASPTLTGTTSIATLNLTNALTTAYGGTGLTSFTAGDLPYYAAGTVLSKLAIGTAGQILTSSGTAPQWSTLSGVAVTTFNAGTTGFTPSTATSGAITLAGTLATTNGGTGLTSFTANGVVYASSTSALATGSALTFDGTKLSLPTTLAIKGAQNSNIAKISMTRTDQSWSINNETDLRFYGQNTDTESPSSIAHSIGNTGIFIWNNASTASEQMRLTSTGLGIGTSSPSTKLQINASGANPAWLYSTNGTSGSYFGTSGGGETIVYQTGAYPIQFYTNSTERMRLDSSGNLGLGVTPSAWNSSYKAVQVGSVGAVWSNSTGAGSTHYSNNTGFDSVGFKYLTTSAASRYEQSSGAHFWSIAASGTAGAAITFTQAMTLDASGRNLIGLTSTQSNNAQLQVKRTDATVGATTYSIGWLQNATGYQDGLNVLATDQVVILAADYAGTNHGTSLLFATNSGASAFGATERARIDSSGNLGLGVTPSAWASSARALDFTYPFIGMDANGAGVFGFNAYNSASGVWRYKTTDEANRFSANTDGSFAWYTAASGTAGNAITFTQAMTLDASGNLLVGQTSTGRQDINGISLEPKVSGGGYAVFNHATGSSSGRQFLTFAYAGTEIGSVTQDGTTGVLFNTSSDYRLKNITGPITTSGAYIDSLNPVEGTWKADGSTFVGLIAHEVQEASRTNVATGTKDGEEMQAMDYSNPELIANMLAELKSLRKRLADAGI